MDLKEFSDADLLANLKDETLPLTARRQLARELARRSSAAALAALKDLAAHAAPGLRAIVAEALGHSARPEAKDLLFALLGDPADSVVLGAIRGLSALGDTDAIRALAALLADSAGSPALRTAAALGLGEMKSPAAVAILLGALRQMDDSSLKEAVLVALGRQPFASTEPFFRAYLDAPDGKPSLRVAALESVAGAAGAGAPFLLPYTRDTDPQVRAAAAWALTMVESQPGTGGELAGLLANEPDAAVRTRLYQALGVQEDFDFSLVRPFIERESDLPARLAGYNLWAGQCAADRQSVVAVQFDQFAVPQLQQLALGTADRNDELTAVIALRQAGTAAAQTAQQQIAGPARDPKVIAAAQAALAARNLLGRPRTNQITQQL